MKTWRWQAQIGGNPACLTILEQDFSNSRIRIFSANGPEDYRMESDAFDDLADAPTVYARSKELLESLVGYFLFEHKNAGNLSVSGICKKHDDGRQEAYVFPRTLVGHSEIFGGRAYAASHDEDLVAAEPYRRPIVHAVELSLSDPVMAKVLRLTGKGATSWVDMYRICEVIEKDLGGQHETQRLDWICKADLRRFKHTANSATATGDLARHGSENTSPPAVPMSLIEGQSFCSHMLESWIEHRMEGTRTA